MVEIIYKLVTRVIQYFYFPDKPMKGGGILEKGGRSRKGGVWSPLPTMIQIDELMELYLIFTWKLILCFLSKSDSIWNLKQYENSNHLVLIPSHYLFVLRKNLKEFFCLCWNGAWYKKLYGPFLWLGFNCLKATDTLRGDYLLFNIQFSGVSGTQLINLRRMKH